MYDIVKNEVLKIEDVHSHWHFEDSAVTLLKVTSKATFKATFEATFKAIFKALNVKINDDISTFLVLDLSNSLLQV